jgi:hypothetical protein
MPSQRKLQQTTCVPSALHSLYARSSALILYQAKLKALIDALRLMCENITLVAT